MANPGKFISVNLNKSYGRPSSSTTSSSSTAPASSYPFGNGRRSRVGGAGGGGGGGGGGMVVLSRPRSSVSVGQKSGPRLSVPPPLNLPSLRKEHERFDSSKAPGGSAGAAGSSGLGSGHGSSGTGWTMPALPSVDRDLPGRSGVDGQGQPGSSIRPPIMAERAVVLRGEDFPSLSATFLSSQKQKDGLLDQKQKQKQVGQDVSTVQAEKRCLESSLHMRPQMKSSRLADVKELDGDGGSGSLTGALERPQKQDSFLPGPLPLFRLSHTSDWADDERDTGHGILDRDRRLPRGESVRGYDLTDGLVPHDSEREFYRGDSFGRDLVAPNREGQGREVGSWRVPPHSRDGLSAREHAVDRDGISVRPSSVRREMSKEGVKYGQSQYEDNARNGYSNGTHDPQFGRRDMGSGHITQNGKSGAETLNGRSTEQNMRGRNGDLSNNRYGGYGLQSSPFSKAPRSSRNRGFPLDDPILNFGGEKHLFPKGGKSYVEDVTFDIRDPFSGGLLGDINAKVIKRKKDVLKQVDFHDPARESFEAELERVQSLQEQERQRVLEEQARALELARKEEEERERLVREEEERRKKLEEEAREAAWREEQERLEVAKRAEEQKIAREEEKRRILMEEERRKEAARQKLLELEARIARRQAEATCCENRSAAASSVEGMHSMVKEKNAARVANVADWEDGERMVERLTGSASSDSSSFNRSSETGSRPQSWRDVNPSFVERDRHTDLWKRDENVISPTVFSQDQENEYCSPRRGAFGSGRLFPRKEIFEGPSAISAQPSSKGVLTDPPHRWTGEGDHYHRSPSVDVEFLDSDKFGDVGWGHSHSRSSPHAPYADRLFQNSEIDGFSSYGRSRHSLRQPRVLPPPSMSSVNRSPFRAVPEHPSSSVFLESEDGYQNAGKGDEETMKSGFDSGYRENLQQPTNISASGEHTLSLEEKHEKTSPRCDSQSSLSVTSPPSSPTHLSHDDLDDSGDSPALPASADGGQITLSDNEHDGLELETGKVSIMVASSSISHGEDDEWAVENNEEVQEQEEYDEEVDGYEEEDEVHDGDDENLDLAKKFEELHSEVQNVADQVDQLVLGFDEGVEVKILNNDDFDQISKNIEKEIGRQTDPVGAVQEVGSTGDLVHNGECHLQTDNTFSQVTRETIDETEKALQDLVSEPLVPTSHLMDSVDTTGSSGMPAQQLVTSTLNLPLPSPSSVQPSFSSVSTVPGQPEAPINLQFGLFSGPSLIPSPVPAIQIGSIQMPLHLHPPIVPSLNQMHPSQSHLFQFGQLRYTSPISQGILPLTPQNMQLVQPNVPSHFSFSPKLGGSLYSQVAQDSSAQVFHLNDKMPLFQMSNPPRLTPKLSQEKSDGKELIDSSNTLKNEIPSSQNQAGNSTFSESTHVSRLVSSMECQGTHDVSSKKNYGPVGNRGSQCLPHSEQISSQFPTVEKSLNRSKSPAATFNSRGKRYVYTIKNSGSRQSLSRSEPSSIDSSSYQRRPRRNIRRTEFRVRENDKRHAEVSEPSNYVVPNEKPNFNGRASGISARSGVKRDAYVNKSAKSGGETENLTSVVSGSPFINSECRLNKTSRTEPSLHAVTGSLKRNAGFVEDIDAPLQSGVVRVFKQPGIEAPSDEDDFIEVRSKRQMLNDRREQREKEIKAKSRMIKALRKPRPVSQNNALKSSSNRTVTPLGGNVAKSVHSDSILTDVTGFTKSEPSAMLTANVASQPLPPIGTPAISADADMRSLNMKSVQMSAASILSRGGTKLMPGLSFENQNAAIDNVPTSLGPWCNTNFNQQVMALTQTQLDEAMKPPRFEMLGTSVGDHSGIIVEPAKSSTSVASHDKQFSSSGSSLNSLFLGEKIQFGAVTSPPILPPVSRAVSNGIGPPCSGSRTDVSVEHNFSVPKSDCTAFFEKEKVRGGPSVHLDDPESEAEAAASAVAVAAISSDEVVGNGLGAPVSISETKSFGGSNISRLSSGVTGSLEMISQSAREELLTVALPADLSVENPPLPLWPPLPSPQSSSSPLISHFPGAPSSHFPCFEMNPMLGGPIFAFGPHEDSVGTQSQSQRSANLGSGPLGTWPQCHSAVDSFYGPPTGFSGPFITPPGGIPGIQGPPHMVVYNHFTPVGQFGQLGLSFMGATYIPSGRQPDWKHNPGSSVVGVSEGDATNLNGLPGQHNPPCMPASIQHLGPSSPLMPVASPLAMFDMPPFQSSADISVQARWSHVPAPPLHSVPLSVPLQKHQMDGGMPLQFSHGLPVDPSAGSSRFHESHSSTAADGRGNLAGPTDAAVQFPDELGLVETPSASTAPGQTSRPSSYSSSNVNNSRMPNGSKSSVRNTVANSSEVRSIASGNSSNQIMGSSTKPQVTQPSTSSVHQYLHPVSSADQRGSLTSFQKVGSGGEWHRRMGFQGRNQMPGTDKNFSAAKMRQIYVAKPPTSGTGTPG